jgi:hypothetical protein
MTSGSNPACCRAATTCKKRSGFAQPAPVAATRGLMDTGLPRLRKHLGFHVKATFGDEFTRVLDDDPGLRDELLFRKPQAIEPGGRFLRAALVNEVCGGRGYRSAIKIAEVSERLASRLTLPCCVLPGREVAGHRRAGLGRGGHGRFSGLECGDMGAGGFLRRRDHPALCRIKGGGVFTGRQAACHGRASERQRVGPSVPGLGLPCAHGPDEFPSLSRQTGIRGLRAGGNAPINSQ